MKQKLQASGLEDQLVPQYGVGCRRPTPGVGYLEALTSDNVETVVGEIKQVTPHGIVDRDGKEHPIDVLVCATGFDTTFKPRFPLLGAKGKSLEDEWAESTKAYMATTITDFPNYFMFFGPNNPFASGSYISAIGNFLDPSQRRAPDVLTSPFRMSSRLHAQILRPLANREHPFLLPETRSRRRLPVSHPRGARKDSLGRRMPIVV